jgi:hypothetical protein
MRQQQQHSMPDFGAALNGGCRFSIAKRMGARTGMRWWPKLPVMCSNFSSYYQANARASIEDLVRREISF